MTIERWIILAITVVQFIHLIGRWTGRIDVTGAKSLEEIKKLEHSIYKHTQELQVLVGKMGIAETNIDWIKKVIDRRKT